MTLLEHDVAVEALREAEAKGLLAFCANPPRPLLPRHLAVCPLAEDVPNCEALLARCREAEDPSRFAWLGRLASAITPLLSVAIWLVVGIAILAIVVPLVLAWLRRRNRAVDHDRAPKRGPSTATLVTPSLLDEGAEAEAVLREADARRASGDGTGAVALYLRAAVRALDRRGALRARRTSTNGEYVRACTDAAARGPLAVIAREVDRATFGGRRPSDDALGRVAELARGLVRAGARMAGVVLAIGAMLSQSACTPPGRRGSADPAGDDLVLEVLRHAGHDVDRLAGSVGELGPDDLDVLVVDSEKVALDEEVSAHLVGWVEQGGTLVIVGTPTRWPSAFGAKPGDGGFGNVVFESTRRTGERTPGGNLLDASGLSWPESQALAWRGESVVAAYKPHGEGFVVGMTSADVLTNVGVANADRAAFVIALLDLAAEVTTGELVSEGGARARVRFARPEDGIAPPGDPLSALVRAGLGPFVWHALLACMVLFLAVGLRQARPRKEAVETRRAFAEHVIATGSLWHRARAGGLAVAVYARFVERRLRRATAASDDPLTLAATRAGMTRDEVRAVLDHAKTRDREELTERATVDAIRELAALLPPLEGRR